MHKIHKQYKIWVHNLVEKEEKYKQNLNVIQPYKDTEARHMGRERRRRVVLMGRLQGASCSRLRFSPVLKNGYNLMNRFCWQGRGRGRGGIFQGGGRDNCLKEILWESAHGKRQTGRN